MLLELKSIKTTFMEAIGTGVLNRNKEHYLRSKDKAEKNMMYQDIYNCICQSTEKMKIYNPLCQTYSPTIV